MHWTDRRTRFREVLNGNRCVHPGSVYDAISARIAEDLGFELGMFAGSVASLTVLGAPDLIVLTLSEFAQQAYRINRAGKLPLMVDADHGYGNALNVKRTVEELETAGIGGMSIEDTELPTPFGTTKPRLTTIAEGVGKMKAALAGRQDPLLGSPAAPARSRSPASTSHRPRQGLRGGRRRALFFVGVRTRAELDASRPPRPCRSSWAADARAHRQGLPRAPPRPHRAAGPPALRRRREGDIRDAEGAARGRAARQAAGRRRRRADEAGHARGGLHGMDEGVPGRIGPSDERLRAPSGAVG